MDMYEKDIHKKIESANEKAVQDIIMSEPVWVDIMPAGEAIRGMEDHMVLHSGPPIDFDNMCELHKRGMVNAALFEGWAGTEEEAIEMIKAEK